MKDDKKKARLILERWTSELATKDKSRGAVSNNFEDLFNDLWNANVPFDIAHELLNEATKKHYPNNSTAKFTYKKLKSVVDKTYQEFVDDWKQSIASKATQAFYAFYPVDGENDNKEKKDKKVGGMSVQEYSKQRKYAESYPVLDTDALKKKFEEIENNEDFVGADDERD